MHAHIHTHKQWHCYPPYGTFSPVLHVTIITLHHTTVHVYFNKEQQTGWCQTVLLTTTEHICEFDVILTVHRR